MIVRTKTQLERVLEVLIEGPATSTEIAAELGWKTRHVSAYLSYAHASGAIHPIGKRRHEPGNRLSTIYAANTL